MLLNVLPQPLEVAAPDLPGGRRLGRMHLCGLGWWDQGSGFGGLGLVFRVSGFGCRVKCVVCSAYCLVIRG